MEGVGDIDLKLDLPEEFSLEAYTESMLFDLERQWLSISLQFSMIQLTDNPDKESLKIAFKKVLTQVEQIKKS